MNYDNKDVIEYVEMNNIYTACKRNGIETGLGVTQKSTPDMSVDVATGTCFIDGAENTELGIVNVVITNNSTSYPRKDIIVYDDSGNNPQAIAGTAQTNPYPPDLTSDQILLAIVNVAASASSIVTANIIDRRCYIRSLPKNLVVMWSGASDAVPSGWALCDGNNGTTDFRDKFIIGTGSTYIHPNTGGATEHDHILGLSGAPAGDGFAMSAQRTDLVSNLPPYYALCFIIKL